MQFTFRQLSQRIQNALEEIEFVKPTPIQESAIPVALEGKDILIQARTGTGKTGAFGIPIIEKLQRGERALILAPTRELAIQIKDHLRELTRFSRVSVFAFYGGTSVGRDLSLLEKRIPDIVVGTPGRVKDLIERGALKLDTFRYLVLDEVDIMLDMGFREDIEWIVSKLPEERQTFFVSATVPREIKEIARKFMKPGFEHVSIESEELKPRINEIVVRTRSEIHKTEELERILRENKDEKVIVFVKMKKNAKELAYQLRRKGYNVEALHGDMTQKRRETVMRLFRNGNVKVLVATDVASRGLDIEGVSIIINFHLPEDPRVYTHRIGRTGRFGREGTAISLVSPSEKRNLWRIEKHKEQTA
ncbi:ATP-dependent RNA helicase DeaD [Hydrogenivirga caldilitoris]|uniref:RNA helicase n=1 Tax=Hydrogenivirga caldilitoris TaxID=246264 RepID=A0A497XT77_9AQUI|nr:DEAD/DEAH box helicase [Hydrogenivirga caldilitoris]RLJ70342.1 ATP-dependent RNA helicase DeaD [Hydrogenivirga caldilitoris]